MSITLSEHAMQQIKRRGISEDLVTKSVEQSDEIISSYRGRKLRRKHIGDKILEIVTKTEGSQITIITAYFLEE